MRGFYAVHNPDLNFLGLAPHSTSTKTGAVAGIIPVQIMETLSNQSLWTWLITGSIVLGVTLILSLWVHPAMLAEGLDLWLVILIETLISAAVAAVLFFLLVPFLNEFFNGDGKAITAISPADIGLTVPSEGTTTMILGTAVAVTCAAAKRLRSDTTEAPKTQSKPAQFLLVNDLN